MPEVPEVPVPQPTADADAAASAPKEPIRLRDLGRDLLRPSLSHLVFAVVLALVAFGATVVVQSQSRDDSYENLRRTDLIALLDDLTAESRRLETEIAALESTSRQLQSGVDSAEVAAEAARTRLESLKLLAGTVRAHGPGVRITIHDPANKVTPELLFNAVSELRDAGAEVIEVNDSIRLVASSWVAAGSGGVVLDGRLVAQPIVIEAIGDAQTLAEATRFRGGLVSSIEGPRVGGRVGVTTVDDLRIDSVVTPPDNQYARPA